MNIPVMCCFQRQLYVSILNNYMNRSSDQLTSDIIPGLILYETASSVCNV